MNELPPLPEETLLNEDHSTGMCGYGWTEQNMRDYARAAIEAHEARKVPDGWKLVPIEPTLEMVGAWKSADQQAATEVLYRTMLASAPPAPQHENETINKLRAGYPAAIDAAIREQASVLKPEPVAKITKAGENVGVVEWLVHSGRPIRVGQALYTHPAPVREPLTMWTGAQHKRAYDNSPELHKDVPTFAAFKRVAIAVAEMYGITKDTQ